MTHNITLANGVTFVAGLDPTYTPPSPSGTVYNANSSMNLASVIAAHGGVGTCIYLANGTYTTGVSNIVVPSGTWILGQSQAGVIIQGSSSLASCFLAQGTWTGGTMTGGTSNVIVENLTVQGFTAGQGNGNGQYHHVGALDATTAGSGGTGGWQFRNLLVQNNGTQGIVPGGNGSKIYNCTITGNGNCGIGSGKAGDPYSGSSTVINAVSAGASPSNFNYYFNPEISYCEIATNAGDSTQTDGSGSKMLWTNGDSWHNNYIHDNYSPNNAAWGVWHDGFSRGANLTNNWYYNNSVGGEFWEISFGMTSTNSLFQNNGNAGGSPANQYTIGNGAVAVSDGCKNANESIEIHGHDLKNNRNGIIAFDNAHFNPNGTPLGYVKNIHSSGHTAYDLGVGNVGTWGIQVVASSIGTSSYNMDTFVSGQMFYWPGLSGALTLTQFQSLGQESSLGPGGGPTPPPPAPSNYVSYIPTLPPYSWWQMVETSGTTMTDTEGTQNGTYPASGKTLAVTDPGAGANVPSNSVVFTTGQGSIPSNYQYQFATGATNAFTIIFRAKINNTGIVPILSYGNSATTGWSIQANTSAGTIGMTIANLTSSVAGFGLTDEMHTIALAWDGTKMNFYQDGVLIGTNAGSLNGMTAYSQSPPILVGGGIQIDQLMFVKSTLSAGIIANVYNYFTNASTTPTALATPAPTFTATYQAVTGSWSAISNAASYLVTQTIGTSVTTYTVTTNSISLPNVAIATNITYTVQALPVVTSTTYLPSAQSSVQTVTTTQAPSTPQIPAYPTFSGPAGGSLVRNSDGSTSIYISPPAPPFVIAGFNVYNNGILVSSTPFSTSSTIPVVVNVSSSQLVVGNNFITVTSFNSNDPIQESQQSPSQNLFIPAAVPPTPVPPAPNSPTSPTGPGTVVNVSSGNAAVPTMPGIPSGGAFGAPPTYDSALSANLHTMFAGAFLINTTTAANTYLVNGYLTLCNTTQNSVTCYLPPPEAATYCAILKTSPDTNSVIITGLTSSVMINNQSSVTYTTPFTGDIFYSDGAAWWLIPSDSSLTQASALATPSDPFSVGFAVNAWPGITSTSTAWFGANVAIFTRWLGYGYSTTGLRINVATSAGNIDIGSFSSVQSGNYSLPQTKNSSSGSTACPAAGGVTITVPFVTISKGDYSAFACSSTSAIFTTAGAGIGPEKISFCYGQNSAFPLPPSSGGLFTAAPNPWMASL